jgi:hypothetical protein
MLNSNSHIQNVDAYSTTLSIIKRCVKLMGLSGKYNDEGY